MKHLKLICSILFTLVIFGLTTGGVTANSPGAIADFPASDVRWVRIEDWTQPGHGGATFAKQRDGAWYSVEQGYELDFQLHPHSAAAVDRLVSAVINLPVLSGPSAVTPAGLQFQSTDPGYTPPDFGAELIADNGDYRYIWAYPLPDGELWAAVWDSVGHYNYYQLVSDIDVMNAIQLVRSTSGS